MSHSYTLFKRLRIDMATLLVSFPPSIPHNYSNFDHTTTAFKSLYSSYSTSFPFSNGNVFSTFKNTKKSKSYSQNTNEKMEFRLQSRRCQWQRTRTRAQEGEGNRIERYLEEDGGDKDMDDYLDGLSLEYDSVWDTKPAWCQPWTIGLVGVLAVSASWIIFQSIILTTVVTSLVCAWWYIFLYSYPQAYAEMIAERRKKVKSGLEDTYGVKKVQ